MTPTAHLSSSALPTLSSSQVKAVDRICAERFGIPTEWLMEAAGWRVASALDRRMVTVLCGVGNNAGDGLAAARHLHRRGNLRAVCCIDPQRLKGGAAREFEVLTRLGIDVKTEPERSPQIVDAIFGTGLSRPPEGVFAEWIEWVNRLGAHVVSIDVPSGLDAETGVPYAPIVEPDLTVALGLPKRGLTGQVVVADIGVPSEAYAAAGVTVPKDLFAEGWAVRL